MNAKDIELLVWKNNVQQTIFGIAMVVGSVILWPLSYWIFYFLFRFFLVLIGAGNSDTISCYLAWGGIILLVVEGYRYNRAGVDLHDSSRLEYTRSATGGIGSGGAASLAMFGVSNPGGLAFIVSQVLFCAPTMTISTIRAFKSYIRTTPDSFEQAASVYTDLARHRKWIPASEYRQNMAGVMLLDRLKMIWKESKEGTMQLRIPPGEG